MPLSSHNMYINTRYIYGIVIPACKFHHSLHMLCLQIKSVVGKLINKGNFLVFTGGLHVIIKSLRHLMFTLILKNIFLCYLKNHNHESFNSKRSLSKNAISTCSVMKFNSCYIHKEYNLSRNRWEFSVRTRNKFNCNPPRIVLTLLYL